MAVSLVTGQNAKKLQELPFSRLQDKCTKIVCRIEIYTYCTRRNFTVSVQLHLMYTKVKDAYSVFYEITNRCSYMQSILFHC